MATGIERMSIDTNGIVRINGLNRPGVVHTDSTGALSTSQVIASEIASVSNSALPTALTGQTLNGVTLTSHPVGLSMSGGTISSKSLTIGNTLTLIGEDGSELDISTGGRLAPSAFTDTTNASKLHQRNPKRHTTTNRPQ